MKKQINILFSALFLLSLTGCNGNNEKRKLNISEILEKLKDGYSLDVLNTSVYTVTGSTNKSKTTYKGYEEISASSTKYRHVTYGELASGDPNKDTIYDDSFYTKDGDGIVKESLSLANKVEKETVSGKSWASAYLTNAFSFFKESDFELIDGAYTYKDGSNKNAAKHLGDQLKGFPRDTHSSVSSLVLTPNDDGTVSFEAKLPEYTITYLTTISVSETYSGTFLSMGKEVESIKPIAKEENKAFSEAMKKLSPLNFKVSGANYEILAKDGQYEKVDSLIASSSGESFAYTIYDEANKINEDSAYYEKDGKLQKFAFYDGIAYLSGKEKNATIKENWPTFEMSSVFFNEKDGKFILDEKYKGMFSNTTIFTPFVQDSIDSLEIEIMDDEIKFTSTNSGNGSTVFANKTEMTYSDFGKQTKPTYSPMEDSSDLTWDKIIRNGTNYSSLVSELGGKAILNAIPTFGGIYSEGGVASSNGIPYLYTYISSLEDGESLFDSYVSKLVNQGFEKTIVSYEDGTKDEQYKKDVGKISLALTPMYVELKNAYTGESNGTYIFAIFLQTSSN